MIINVRGTNGSGKSTVVRRFVELAHRELFGSLGPHRPEAYEVKPLVAGGRSIYVLGPYQTPTGGVDAAGWTVPQLIELIEKYAARGHVLFEGVVISTTFGALGEWLVNRYIVDALVLFLDTPLEVCLDGVAARGGNREALHIATKHKVIAGVRQKFVYANVRTESVSREDAYARIREWLT